MFRSLRQITVESNQIVEKCSLFNPHQTHKHNVHISQPKQSLANKSKKKIKCPPSKFLKHQKHSSQTHQNKAISPAPAQPATLQFQSINFKTSNKTKKVEFGGLPPVYKHQQPNLPIPTRPVQYIIHSPRQINEIRRYESPGHNRPLQFYQANDRNTQKQTLCSSQNQYRFIGLAPRQKTLQEFDPKMAESVINSAIDQFRMEQSQIMINFFNQRVGSFASQTHIEDNQCERGTQKEIELTDSGSSQ